MTHILSRVIPTTAIKNRDCRLFFFKKMTYNLMETFSSFLEHFHLSKIFGFLIVRLSDTPLLMSVLLLNQWKTVHL